MSNPSGGHGKPSGISHDRNKDVGRQSDSSDNNSWIETIPEHLRLSGEPYGNTSSTSKPMIVDPVVVDNNGTQSICHQCKNKKRKKQKRLRLSYEEHAEKNTGCQSNVNNLSLGAGKTSIICHDQNKEAENDPRVETIGKDLRLSGEPHGNTGSTSKPMIVDPAIADNNGIQSITRLCNLKEHKPLKQIQLSYNFDIMTHEELARKHTKIENGPKNHYLKALNPPTAPPISEEMSIETQSKTIVDWETEIKLSKIEDEAIKMFESQEGCIMPYMEKITFDLFLRRVNSVRIKKNYPIIEKQITSPPIEEYILKPGITLCYPENIDGKMSRQVVESKYKDQLVAAQVELDAIEYITSGNISRMMKNKEVLFSKYLKQVNEMREINDHYPLNFDLSFEEHIRIEYPGYNLTPSNTQEKHSSKASLKESSVSTDSLSEKSSLIDDSDLSTDTCSTPRTKKTVPECIDLTTTSIELLTPSRLCSNNLTMGKTLRLSCKPQGNTSSTSLPMRVDPSKVSYVTNTKLLPKEKQLNGFISELLNIVSCPITMTTLKDPVTTKSGTVYDRDEIYKWLSKNSYCPMTRNVISIDQLSDDHTMNKLVKTMKNHDITSDFLKEMRNEISTFRAFPISSTIEEESEENVTGLSNISTLHIPVELSATMLRKKRRKKENRKEKKKLNEKIRRHKTNLENHGYFDNEYLRWNMPKQPSYSLMHSLSHGFSLVLYSRSHCVNLSSELCLPSELCLHRNSAIRLILPSEMCLILHESIYYSRDKSRNIPDALNSPFNHPIVLPDQTFFAYVWPFVKENNEKLTTDSCDDVARERGDKVYRENLHKNRCSYLREDFNKCVYCKDEEMTIDLRTIPKNSYSPGNRIIGDLDMYGWLVVRSASVPDTIDNAIKDIGKLGGGWSGQWHKIDKTVNRMKKYKPSSMVHNEWSSGLPKQFLDNVNKFILQDNLDDEKNDLKYVIEKFNLIQNVGMIHNDDMPHTDYAPRL